MDFGSHGYFVRVRPFNLRVHPCFIALALNQVSKAAFATKDMLNSYSASTALDTAASVRDFLGTMASGYSEYAGAFPFEASYRVAFDWDIAHYSDS